MIPLTVADEVKATLLNYLTTTFNLTDTSVEDALVSFLTQPQGGIFQGPYLHLRLPFRKTSPDSPLPLTIRPGFTPYVHQVRAFQRLTSGNGHAPEPTLITTGTGSGKTECFLFPILDHCYRHRGEPGIKAIILYPMNALATDQARRLADLIHQDEHLRGQVRAGLYVGGDNATPHTQMEPDSLIDDRATLRQHPPDILLTNYKMLDFLLLRPEDKPLWAGNGSDTLRYLVLDELHTYDGAQGSDVACLIRRLQARLNISEGVLCPVGTSATVISESGATQEKLTAFAGQIFAQSFPLSAVIGEERISLSDFLPGDPTQFDLPASLTPLIVQPGESHNVFVTRQMASWFGHSLTPVELGKTLRGHSFLRALLAASQNQILPLPEICQRLSRWEPAFADLTSTEQQTVLQSFLALIATARTEDGNRLIPFLTLQSQLWVREMSRLMRQVSPEPAFFWRDDLPDHSTLRGLPAYVCRECGHSGWLAVRREGDDSLDDDSQQIYRHFFDRHRATVYLYPAPDPAFNEAGTLIQDHLCPTCLRLGFAEQCPICQVATIPVVLNQEWSQPRGNQPPRDLQRCPACATDGSLSILGRQAASLLSVAISHLFTSPLNSDNKLLAFTDSVQDASHRAAFFAARTYRFSLRTAFQALLTHAEQQGTLPIPLAQFTDQLVTYWLERWARELPAAKSHQVGQKLVAAFMPPDLQDVAVYRHYLRGRGQPIPADLRDILNKRLSWEVTMEYGFNAHVGRSLEKVGSSRAMVDPTRLHQAVSGLVLALPEEIGLLRGIDAAAVHHFVLGILERTRTRGGVTHHLLRHYLREQGNTYLLSKRMTPLLSPFGQQSPRYPRFLNDGGGRDNFDQYITRGNRSTWYVDWAQRVLSRDLGIPDINDIYRLVMTYLVNADILEFESQGQAHSYGIQPSALLITNQTSLIHCDTCGQQQTVTPGTQADWIGQACLNFRCRGHYRQPGQTGLLRLGQRSYYRALYEQGQVERIFSYEHTGLLPREERERIETGFKTQNQADAPNLLTATPTLEMGIDVGDLSATVACAVPPTTANYLQRIGRAGRATGNSLILTLANAKPHDLYYFEQPLEMIAGAIVPPGCYLDAPNMLQRQFLAFTMDCWTAATEESGNRLPRNVKEMLSGLSRQSFPVSMLLFYNQHKTDLIERFLGLFGPVISADNQTWLRSYAAGNDLPETVTNAVLAVQEERENLRKEYRALRRELDKIKAAPAQYDNPEAQMTDLEREMRLIGASINTLEEVYILNFFTDAGLLPNYAFPETGVKLRAIITGVEASDGNKHYLAKEYVRPAPLAIRELAPFNTFYAEARKVMVNGLNLRGKDAVIERWQFCNRCATMSPVSSSHYSSSCPECGSSLWHDAGQQHDMIRLREVTARTDQQRSLSGDDSDDRERETYQTGLYFDLDPEQSLGAFLISAMPFGIEALRQVTLREINYGLKETFGRKVVIADEEQPETGFLVCPDCGVVMDPRQREEKEQVKHARSCVAVRGRGQNNSVNWHNLYLYREMRSEALRILLPVSTVLIAEKLATFQACLELGLRRKFQGDPDHLRIAPSVEVSPDGTRRRFLMVYDTVPGGTSYLRDLVQPHNFRDILLLALDTLTSCSCRLHSHKQACYRCLYSYHTQYDKALISRRLGVEMLQEILAAWPTIQPVASLSGADMISLIESELEQRFVNALEQFATRDKGIKWQVKLHQGKTAFLMTLGDQQWLIEPQVTLGIAHGIAQASKPDFVLWPQGKTSPKVRPVAVFTDGFAFHVQPEQTTGRLADDIRKRQALVASGKFWVWSLTWDDVVEFAEGTAFPLAWLNHQQKQQFKLLLKQTQLPDWDMSCAENGVAQLVRYLYQPQEHDWTKLSVMLAMTSMIPPRPPVTESIIVHLAENLLTSPQKPTLTIPAGTPDGPVLYSIVEQPAIQLLVYAEQQGLKTANAAAFCVVCRLDDTQSQRAAEGFKNSWRQFWLLANLYQFLPRFTLISAEAIGAAPNEVASVILVEETAETDAAADETWREVLAFTLPECEPLLRRLMAQAYPPPVVGYELTNERNRVAAAAELVWPALKVAVFLPNQEQDIQVFAQAGWQTSTFDNEEGLVSFLRQFESIPA